MENRLVPKIIDTLRFHEVDVSIYEQQGQLWISGEDIGRCLSFSEPRKSIDKIYERHRNELELLSNVIKDPKLTSTDGKSYERRVYNEQGAYIIAMFARTETAKEVRAWLASLPKKIRAIDNKQIWALSRSYEEVNRKYEDLKNLTTEIQKQLSAIKRGGLLTFKGFRDYFEDLALDLADDQQTFSRFIDACCELKKGEGEISRPLKVYREYQNWCVKNYTLSLNKKMFKRALQQMTRKGYRVLLRSDILAHRQAGGAGRSV